MIDNRTILITGGTGNFGRAFVKYLLENYNPGKIILYSRDEHKQSILRKEYSQYAHKLFFMVGDVRDGERLNEAFEGVDYVVHAAVAKHNSACVNDLTEIAETNIGGAECVIRAALEQKVKRVIFISTDNAVNPVNVYGETKYIAEKLFIAANVHASKQDILFSVVRFGNIAGSSGSVIPFFQNQIKDGADTLPITDERITRFWMDQKQASRLVIAALHYSVGGEIFVAKMPSFRIIDLAEALLPMGKTEKIGLREGERLYEVMVNVEEGLCTYEYESFYIIYPSIKWNKGQVTEPLGKKIQAGFTYSSDNNTSWLSVKEISERIEDLT